MGKLASAHSAFSFAPMPAQFTCSTCGKTHAAWPAIAFDSPDNYHQLSDADKATIATISSDFCTITHGDQTDRFIRVTLTQPVNDHCEDLDYGLWVSLSEKSFGDYSDNYNNPDYEAQYFGWLCSSIPGYEFPDSIPTTVRTRSGNQRPAIFPHKNFDHPFVRDFYNGIPKEEAERRVRAMTGEDAGSEVVVKKKPWSKRRRNDD